MADDLDERCSKLGIDFDGKSVTKVGKIEKIFNAFEKYAYDVDLFRLKVKHVSEWVITQGCEHAASFIHGDDGRRVSLQRIMLTSLRRRKGSRQPKVYVVDMAPQFGRTAAKKGLNASIQSRLKVQLIYLMLMKYSRALQARQ